MKPDLSMITEKLNAGISKKAVARELKVCPKTINKLLQEKTWDTNGSLESTDIPYSGNVDELIERRKAEYELKAKIARERSFRNIAVKIDGPIGILHFGDPHVDDDGTDLGLVIDHANLTRTTEGLFGANIGDITNNWVGSLCRLFGEQGTSAQQARDIAQRFLTSVDWLYIVGGNHDYWTNGTGVLDWFAKQEGLLASGRFQYHSVRLGLNFKNGFQCRINARHDFRGASEYHPTHGPVKSRFLDHIVICGHRHVAGYEIACNPDPTTGDGEVGILTHAIRIGSYKKLDSFAREKGLPYQNFAPAIMTIINPYADKEVNKVRVEIDPFEGAERLTWLRKRWKAK